MMKENKFKVILSSAVILLPILFGLILWNQLPDTMATHWGADRESRRIQYKAVGRFSVFLLRFLQPIFSACILPGGTGSKRGRAKKR